MPSHSDARFSAVPRTMTVERLEVRTADVDHNYSRVELNIDGIEFEFSGPDAQVVGAQLNTAGGGDMFQRTKRQDDLERQIAVMRECAARLKVLARVAIFEGNEDGTRARRDINAAIDHIAQGCPMTEEEAADAA